MKKYKIIMSILIILNFVGVVSIIYFYNIGTNKKIEFRKVSVILNSSTSDHWHNLKQGMNQAASDNNVELNFVVLSSEDREKEQCELISREINNGAETILLIPTKGEELADIVSLSKMKVPIITILSGTTGETQSYCVKANNFQMGYDLGKDLLNHKLKGKNIAVIMGDNKSNYIEERKEGFISAMINSQYNIKILDFPKGEDINIEKYNAAIAFDAVGLEYLVGLVSTVNDIEVFGIGSTNAIVSALDKGLIDSLLVENEYNIGYISVQSTTEFSRSNEDIPIDIIDYDIVNNTNMYEKENQRLLFPLIQ